MLRGIMLLSLSCWLAMGVVAEAPPTYMSPGVMVMAPDASVVYIAAQTADRILVLDMQSKAVTREIPLGAAPTGLALSRDGGRLVVTLAGAPGSVAVFNPQDAVELRRVEAGHTPMGPVLTEDARTLYVCNRFNDNVARIDLESGEVTATIPVDREPVAAALSQDGALLFVANQLPSGPADGAYAAATVSVVDTAAGTVSKALPLPNGSSSLRDICLSPDGAYAYVTHILSRYQLPTTQLERGWMNTNALTVIDVAKQELVNTVLLDSVDLGAANPWAVACTKDGGSLLVTHAGTHEISVIDRAALHDKLDRVAQGEKVTSVSEKAEDVPNDLSFLVDLRRRIRLSGNGPRAVVVADTRAWVAEYFSDSLCVVDIAPDARPRPESITLASAAQTPERLGEQHFNDAALCFQHWQSCLSCHPDGRADALNWDLLNDGMGNPKNTKSLLYSHVTPPVMMTGVRANAETAVRSGIKFIQFAVRPEEDAEAIDAFLKAMRPLPSPWLVNGELSELAKEGKKIFNSVGCVDCHAGDYHTDKQRHDVGTGTGREEGTAFDTPSLKEIWRTAPYLYDGRATTIREVITTFNPENRHGATKALTEEQIDALVAYVNSL